MKNQLAILITILLLLTNCTNVYFYNPQPQTSEEFKQIPKELQGTYITPSLEVKNGKRLPSKYDTLLITNNQVKYVNSEGKTELLAQIRVKNKNAKQLVLKKYDKYYIFNIKEQNFWIAFPVIKQENALIVYAISYDKQNPKDVETLKKLSQKIEFKKNENNVEYAIIEPKAFGEIIATKELFENLMEFKQIK